MPAGLPFSAQKRVRRRGSTTVNRTAGERALSWAAALRAAPNQGLARTDVRIVSGLEQAHHRCRWAVATGLRVGAGPACRRTDVVAATREGGMAVTPFQVERDTPS